MCQDSGSIVQAGCAGDIAKGDIIGGTLPLVCIWGTSACRSYTYQLSRCGVITDALIGRNGSDHEIRIYRDGYRIGGNGPATRCRGLVQPVDGGLCQGSGLVVQAGSAGDVGKDHIVGRALPLVRIGNISTCWSYAGQLGRSSVVTDALVSRDQSCNKIRIHRNRNGVGGNRTAPGG